MGSPEKLKQIYANYIHYTIQPQSNTIDRVGASPGANVFPTPLCNEETRIPTQELSNANLSGGKKNWLKETAFGW